MKPEKTWIVIADAGHARFYETIGTGQKLVELESLARVDEIPPGRELERDRPSRSFESSSPVRHGTEPAETARRGVKRAFAETVAATLDQAISNKACDRIVIAAPPAMLGDLRAAMKPETRSYVAAELAKDLVKIPVQDLRKHFETTILI